MTIDTPRYRDNIANILAAVGLPHCELHIVESVHRWAAENGVSEKNPNRLGMALRGNGKVLVVLKSAIDDDDRHGVTGGMMFRGFTDELKQIESGEAFFEHLVLHESAHLLWPDKTEVECDEWAFEQLGRLPLAAPPNER